MENLTQLCLNGLLIGYICYAAIAIFRYPTARERIYAALVFGVGGIIGYFIASLVMGFIVECFLWLIILLIGWFTLRPRRYRYDYRRRRWWW